MSQYNLKNSNDEHNVNVDSINPRLHKAMEKLRSAIDAIDMKANNINITDLNKTRESEESFSKLLDEKNELFSQIEDLKDRNEKLENANKLVQSKINNMISSFNKFLDKA
tara:strand:+ start:24609 stop:24938 length:330 start_codon:yes stop_codon:yes gene_type:complete